MHVEELRGASVQAHALALVELTLAIVVRNALALAHLVESVVFVANLRGLVSAFCDHSGKQ